MKRSIRLRLPSWPAELVHHAIGCYAAHSGVKRWNRQAELALIRAEKFAALAHAKVGLPFPQAELEHAWKRVLFNQFHDILAGTSLESAYQDAGHEYGEAMAVAQHVTNAAVQRLSWRVKIPVQEGARGLRRLESAPLAGARLRGARGGRRQRRLRDDRRAGRARARSVHPLAGHRQQLAAAAGLGGRVARLRPPNLQRCWAVRRERSQREETVAVSDTHLENGSFRLELDPRTGGIARLTDKRTGAEVFSGPAAVGVVLRDESDTWSHGLVRYDDLIGEFSQARVQVLERGPVRSAVRTVSDYGNSQLTQEFFVYRDPAFPIEVRVRVDWHEAHKLLKLRFPVNVTFGQATYEAPYGTVSRPGNGEEYPGGRWVDLSGVNKLSGELRGVGLINDAKSSYSISGSDLHLTVLRSPIYAHHDPYVPVPGGDYRFMDQGEQHFTYWLWPHPGNWRDAGLPRLCAALTEGPVALPETFHAGELPGAQTNLSVTPESVLVTVFKRAEDGGGYVLRLLETLGQPVTASLSMPFLEREFSVPLGANELCTLLLPDDGSAPRSVLLTELEASR